MWSLLLTLQTKCELASKMFEKGASSCVYFCFTPSCLRKDVMTVFERLKMHPRKPFSYIDAPPCELRENLLKKVASLLRIGELDQNYKSDFLPDKKEGKKAAPASAGSQLVSIGIAALWKSGKRNKKYGVLLCSALSAKSRVCFIIYVEQKQS